jgi:hypothetical protein
MEVIRRTISPLLDFNVAWQASCCFPSTLTAQLPAEKPCFFRWHSGVFTSVSQILRKQRITSTGYLCCRAG